MSVWDCRMWGGEEFHIFCACYFSDKQRRRWKYITVTGSAARQCSTLLLLLLLPPLLMVLFNWSIFWSWVYHGGVPTAVQARWTCPLWAGVNWTVLSKYVSKLVSEFIYHINVNISEVLKWHVCQCKQLVAVIFYCSFCIFYDSVVVVCNVY